MSLSDHIITKVEPWKVRTRFPRFHGKNAKLAAHFYGLNDVSLIEITTNEGARGFGLGKPDRAMIAALEGRRVSEVFDPKVGILESVLYHADIALHDLAGKILGIPVKKMISDSCLDRVECYDGSIYMNDISPDRAPGGIKAIIDNCRYDRDVIGFRDFKVKIGRGMKWMEAEEGLMRDIEVIREIRKHFPDARILVDANDAYSVETTMRFMDGVKDCDIYWIEEPFQENAEDLKILKDYLAKNSPHTLIADGEWAPNYIHTAKTVGLVEELAKEKLLDVLLMDTFEFGFTNWRKYMKKVNELGVKASPHNWNLTLKTIYSSHLSAGFGTELVETIEGVGDTTEGIDHSAYTFRDGKLIVPDAPGFGMELIWGRQG